MVQLIHMKKLHSSLEQKFAWYQIWHTMPYHNMLHFLLLIVFVLSVGTISLEKFSVAHAATGDTVYLIGGMDTNSVNTPIYKQVFSSLNATNWSLISSQSPAVTSNILDSNTPYFNGKMWVIKDYATLINNNWYSQVYSSPDGITWNIEATIAFPHQENSGTNHLFVFNTKIWLIRETSGGSNGVVWTNPIYSSSDGITWTHIDTDINTAGIQDGPFPYFGGSHMLSVSVFQNKIFVVGSGGIWSSLDGVNWINNSTTQNQSCILRSEHTSLVFNGKIWLLGGNVNSAQDVCSSPDGVTWTTIIPNAPWSASLNYSFTDRCRFTSFVFNNRMYIGYGYVTGGSSGVDHVSANNIWSSPDGVTWIQEVLTGSTIAPRQTPSTVVIPAQPSCNFNTPTYVYSPNSTPQQYITAGVTNAVTSYFKITTNTGCAPDVITELKFKSLSPSLTANPIASVTVNGITAPFVNGVADVVGLNIPITGGTTGVTIQVKTSYNLISTTNPSGTMSKLVLYFVGGQGNTSYSVAPASGVASTTYMLVKARPYLTITTPTTNLSATNTQNDLVSIYNTAAITGPITVNKIPLTLSLTGTGSIPTTPNMLHVYNASTGALIPTTDTGGLNPVITFTTPVQIPALTPITFKIKIVGLTMGTTANSTTISTKLNTNKALYSWTDIGAGATTTPQTNNNITFLATYPSNTVSVHN